MLVTEEPRIDTAREPAVGIFEFPILQRDESWAAACIHLSWTSGVHKTPGGAELRLRRSDRGRNSMFESLKRRIQDADEDPSGKLSGSCEHVRLLPALRSVDKPYEPLIPMYDYLAQTICPVVHEAVVIGLVGPT